MGDELPAAAQYILMANRVLVISNGRSSLTKRLDFQSAVVRFPPLSTHKLTTTSLPLVTNLDDGCVIANTCIYCRECSLSHSVVKTPALNISSGYVHHRTFSLTLKVHHLITRHFQPSSTT